MKNKTATKIIFGTAAATISCGAIAVVCAVLHSPNLAKCCVCSSILTLGAEAIAAIFYLAGLSKES